MSIVVKAKRLSGDRFTSEDKIQLQVSNTDFGDISNLLCRVITVSGPSVTHGGGANSSIWLNYHNVDDTFANGTINYSNTEIGVVQQSQGSSVVKAQINVLTNAKVAELEADIASTANSGVSSINPEDYWASYETGNITLEWGDDDWV